MASVTGVQDMARSPLGAGGDPFLGWFWHSYGGGPVFMLAHAPSIMRGQVSLPGDMQLAVWGPQF